MYLLYTAPFIVMYVYTSDHLGSERDAPFRSERNRMPAKTPCIDLCGNYNIKRDSVLTVETGPCDPAFCATYLRQHDERTDGVRYWKTRKGCSTARHVVIHLHTVDACN